MRVAAVLTTLALVAATGTASNVWAQQSSGDPDMDKAIRVLSTTPLADGHNDLPWAIRENAGGDVDAYDLRTTTSGHTDLARLKHGMVGIQFWSVYIPSNSVETGAARMQLEQIDVAKRVFAKYPDVFGPAMTPSDALAAFGAGRIGSVIGMEGGHAIENSLGALRAFFEMGARYMTLTHSANTDWADSATDESEHGGLTEFGREIVREMNRLGMLVDLSHTSPETMNDALDVAEAPVIFSHSSARALVDHPRNVPDQVLRRLPANGGIVMVTFVPSFINEKVRAWSDLPDDRRRGTEPPRATIADVADHIEHVRDVAGIDHVGIGGDFDGITAVPVGLEDVSRYPALFAELSRRGWGEADMRKLAGENLLRVWRTAEAVAARLQRQRPASTKTIEELDGRATSDSPATGGRGETDPATQ